MFRQDDKTIQEINAYNRRLQEVRALFEKENKLLQDVIHLHELEEKAIEAIRLEIADLQKKKLNLENYVGALEETTN